MSLNPLVTASFALRRAFAWRRVPIYWASQVAGALVAAVILRMIFGTMASTGVSRLHIESWRGVIVEALRPRPNRDEAEAAAPHTERRGAPARRDTTMNTGGDVYDLVHRLLPDDVYGITLNPGHLIAYEEWVSSPIAAGSTDELRSGMVLQIDVIPSHPVYGSTRMEEGIVIADAGLRAQLSASHPDVLRRCEARRAFMRHTLGYDVPDAVLPLADTAGMVTPFLLDPRQDVALA